MLVLYCQTCCKGCKTYRKWINHLFSRCHQKRTTSKIKSWSKKVLSRTVIFTELCKPGEELQEDVIVKLAWKVSEHTIISNLVFNCEKQICLIVIDEKKGANFVANSDDISCGNCYPYKRIASDVPSSEWEQFQKNGENQPLINISNILQNEEGNFSADDNEQEIQVVNVVLNRFKSFEEIYISEDELDVANSVDDREPNGESMQNSSRQNLLEDSQHMNKEFRKFLKENSLSKEAAEKRKSFVTQLTNALKVHYENVKVYPFDSGLERLSFLKTTPIAVVIDINDDIRSRDAVESVTQHDVSKIIGILRTYKPNGISFCTNVIQDIFQREPKINFRHNPTGMQFECFFTKNTFQYKLNLISNYIKCDPRVSPLFRFLLGWYDKFVQDFADRRFENPPMFNVYYPFMQLIIYFLIHKGVLPTVDYFPNAAKVGITEDFSQVMRKFNQCSKYSACDADPVSQRPTAECILTLAAEFFVYFGKLDFNNKIISLPLGKLVNTVALLNKGNNTFNKLVKLNKKECKNFKRRVRQNNISCLNVQDHFCNAIIFPPFWPQPSEFQNLCKSTSKEIRNVLYGESRLSNLWPLFTRKFNTDSLLLDITFGFVAQAFVKVVSFKMACEVKKKLAIVQHHKIKHFWLSTLMEFFDELIENVLKLKIISTHVKKKNECKLKTIEHNEIQQKRKLTEPGEENVHCSKKLKMNNNKAALKECRVGNLDTESLPSTTALFPKIYIKTYYIENHYSDITSDKSRNMFKSQLRRKKHEDPLITEKEISDFFPKDAVDTTELICKTLIDCNTLTGGLQLETPWEETERRDEEFKCFVNQLVDNYISYRVVKFLNENECE